MLWRMLTYADVCWRMLTYADVCWRMLTYADGCWRLLTVADGMQVILELSALLGECVNKPAQAVIHAGTHFTCFTSTKLLALLVQKYTYWRMLWCTQTADKAFRGTVSAYADVCWRMLTYADVCWRMLTYADSGQSFSWHCVSLKPSLEVI
jgi:hypothetical protein